MSQLLQTAGKNKLRSWLMLALCSTLVVTGTMFAYAYTTASGSITGISQGADFASITTNVSGNTSFNVFGSYRGKIQPCNLFNVTPDSNYNGDLGINVYLDNVDELSYKYSMLMMRIRVMDGSETPIDVEAIDKPLSLHNGVVSFTLINTGNFTPGTTFYIKNVGGIYKTFPWAYLSGVSSGSFSPSLTAEVVQAGL